MNTKSLILKKVFLKKLLTIPLRIINLSYDESTIQQGKDNQ